LRLVTFFPDFPDFSCPRFILCIACPTSFDACFPYLRPELFFRVAILPPLAFVFFEELKAHQNRHLQSTSSGRRLRDCSNQQQHALYARQARRLPKQSCWFISSVGQPLSSHSVIGRAGHADRVRIVIDRSAASRNSSGWLAIRVNAGADQNQSQSQRAPAEQRRNDVRSTFLTLYFEVAKFYDVFGMLSGKYRDSQSNQTQ
jgi:hypothetical protein